MFDVLQVYVSTWPRIHFPEPWAGPDADEELGGSTRFRRAPRLERVTEWARARWRAREEKVHAVRALGRAADSRRVVPGV